MFAPKFAQLAPAVVDRTVARAPTPAHDVVGDLDGMTLVKQRPLVVAMAQRSEAAALNRKLARGRGFMQVLDPAGDVVMTLTPPVAKDGASSLFRYAILSDGKVVAAKHMMLQPAQGKAKRNPYRLPTYPRERIELEARLMRTCNSPLYAGAPVIVGDEALLLSKLLHSDAFDYAMLSDEKFSPVERMAVNRRIFYAVAHTLARLDVAKVMHRDVKPENIFLGPDATVALGDFGNGIESRKGVVSKKPIGTPGYFAPEVLLGEDGSTYSGQADVFSLGVTMLMLLLADKGDPSLFPTFVEEEPTTGGQRKAMADYLKWRQARAVTGNIHRLDWEKVARAVDVPSTEAVFVDLDRAALIAHDADAEMAYYVFDYLLTPNPGKRHRASDVLTEADMLFTVDMDEISAEAMATHLQFGSEDETAFARACAYRDMCAARMARNADDGVNKI